MNPLGIAVWGVGPHARKNLLPALAATPGVRIAGLCSRNAPVLATAGNQFGCRTWTDPDAMLSSSEVDAVCVATPIALHFPHGGRVLDANKHLWCEKPLVEKLAQATALVDRASARSLVVAEGLMYLYHPHFGALAGAVASGRIGSVCSINARFGIPALAQPGFRLDPALGGGAFLDVGCYPISLAAELCSSVQLDVVHAELRTAPGSAVDTSGQAFVRWGDESSAALEWRVGSAYRNEVDVWGSDGSITTDRIFSKSPEHVPLLRVRDKQGTERVEIVGTGNHFIAMFSSFLEMVRDQHVREKEYGAIRRRARLLEQVRVAGGLASGAH